MSAKGLAVQQLVAIILAMVSILVFSLAIMHRASPESPRMSFGDCGYAQCQLLDEGEIAEAMSCPDVAVRTATDLGDGELSWISSILYGKQDSYIMLRDCDFPDMQGRPVMVIGNATGIVKAGSTLDITRIGETVYVCVKRVCERRDIRPEPEMPSTVPQYPPPKAFDYTEKSGIYLAYHAYLPPDAREWKHVAGARIWARWRDLQPEKGTFNCNIIRSGIALARDVERKQNDGRKRYVYIDLIQGNRRGDIPDWVKDSVPMSKCKNGYGINFPLYWSEEYRNAYKHFIDGLSDCIASLSEEERDRIAFVRANVWAYDHENLQSGDIVRCSSRGNVMLPPGTAYPGPYDIGKARAYMYEITKYYKEKFYDRFGIPVTSKAFELAATSNPIGEEMVSSGEFKGDSGEVRGKQGVWFYYTNANPSVYVIRCANRFQGSWKTDSRGAASLLNPCPREHAERAVRDAGVCAQFYCLVRNGFTIGTSEAIGVESQDGSQVPSLVYWTELSSIHLRDAFLGLYETRGSDGRFEIRPGELDFIHEIYTNATKVYYNPQLSNFSLIAFRDFFCPSSIPGNGNVYEFEGNGKAVADSGHRTMLRVHDYDSRVRGNYDLFIYEINPERNGRYLTYYSLGKDTFCRSIATGAGGTRSIGRVQFCGNDICRTPDRSRTDYEMIWAKSSRRLDGSGGRLYLDVDDVFASTISGSVRLKVYYLCEPGNGFRIIYKSAGGEKAETVTPSCTAGYFTWDEVVLDSPVFDNSLDSGADMILDDSGSENIFHMVFLDRRA